MRRGHRIGDGRDAQLSASELRVVDTRERIEENDPFCIPFAITNMGGALVAMDLKFMGPNYSIAGVRDGIFA